MGRKIPGRKHRGVKDPEKQRQQRLDALKNKINIAPLNVDDQDIPKSLTRIMELKNKVKSGKIPEKIKQRHKKNAPISSHPKGYKVNPYVVGKLDENETRFIQRKSESTYQFMGRVNRICNSVIQESKFEEKYGINIQRDKSGKIHVKKGKKDELEVYLQKARQDSKLKGKKKKKKKKEEVKLTKNQKKQAKIKAKKEKRLLNNTDEFKIYEDSVKFGEIVHEPPKNLTKPRRVDKLDGAPRPGRKDLLLKSIMNGDSYVQKNSIRKKITSNESLRKTTNKVINKKGKRKELPNALRRQLDKQQSEVIQAYKDLKKQKHSNV